MNTREVVGKRKEAREVNEMDETARAGFFNGLCDLRQGRVLLHGGIYECNLGDAPLLWGSGDNYNMPICSRN